MRKADEKKAAVNEEDDGEFLLAAHRVKPGRRRVSADERNASIDATGALWGVRN
jgi:hypothetical protein